MRKGLLLLFLTGSVVVNGQLTIQSGASFFIQPGATVTVQGDLTSQSDILGTGTILLKGSSLQNLNMNGFIIPNLQIENVNNVTLTGGARIGSSLSFISGKILTGNFNLELAEAATVAGAGAGKFVQTNGTGKLVKLISSDLSAYVMPVGYNNNYTPISLTTSGTYAAASIGVGANASAHPNKPIRSTDYLNTYWKLTRTGITGSATATATYTDGADVTGAETDMRGFTWDGTNWSLSGATIDPATNAIVANVLPAGVDVYAMNRFVYLNSKIFLQGAYTGGTINGTPVMNDNLRQPTNLIPTSDPYRTTPYNTTFTHINNTVPETVAASVFTPIDATRDLRNDIVDWVFVELRNTNASPGNTVLQTRSALLQRDGDVVEIDGVSPLYFKNIDANNFAVAVRHRNHLGMSSDPGSFAKALSEQNTSSLNLSNASDAQIFGSSAAYTNSGGINLLWGGNANSNVNSRYSGAGNDRATILLDLGGNDLTVLTGYYRSDINMNRQVRYSGANNDRAYLLATVLAGIDLTVRTQQLPN